MPESLRIGFAGDREIAVQVLDFLVTDGIRPKVLLVSADVRASHADELISRCEHLTSERVLRGADFRTSSGIDVVESAGLDLMLGIHFPYIVPAELLALARVGWLNLHPAYLPWNRGWHTASWALLGETPLGATLHFMDDGIDTGDIVHQLRLEIGPGDTADSLYPRLERLEFDVFRQAWPVIRAGTYQRTAQPPDEGSHHARDDLATSGVQKIDPDEQVAAGELLRKLQALTTNQNDEAAYFESEGRRYRVRVEVTEEDPES
jgi:methionyl-tRNA formyltransferase